jgi:hypothetical protein
VSPEIARRVLQPCLHRLITCDVAQLDSHRRAAAVISLDVGRRDLGTVRGIHELEDDEGAWERLAGAIQDLDNQRMPDRITGHSGLTITGHHSELRRNGGLVGPFGKENAVAGTGGQPCQEKRPDRSVGGESAEGK